MPPPRPVLRLYTTEAIMCRLPSITSPGINLSVARVQFEGVVHALREVGVDVIELPPDESSLMSSFVGDVGFVLGGMGVVCRPGGGGGRKTSGSGKEKGAGDMEGQEVRTLRTLLKKELDIPVVEVDDKDACIEGGDILFTGREFFIGLSHYTNEAGAAFLAKTFPEYPCSPIKLPGPHHLSYYVGMVGEDMIGVGRGADGQKVIKLMEYNASFRSYLTVTLPEDIATTALLYVNGTLLHSSSSLTPESAALLAEKLPRRKELELSELVKLENFSLRRLVVLLLGK